MRESVKRFAEGMEEVLKENEWKDHWSSFGLSYLWGRLNEEVGELESSIPPRDDLLAPEALDVIIKECHDVANFAHMIADNAKRLKGEE